MPPNSKSWQVRGENRLTDVETKIRAVTNQNSVEHTQRHTRSLRRPSSCDAESDQRSFSQADVERNQNAQSLAQSPSALRSRHALSRIARDVQATESSNVHRDVGSSLARTDPGMGRTGHPTRPGAKGKTDTCSAQAILMSPSRKTWDRTFLMNKRMWNRIKRLRTESAGVAFLKYEGLLDDGTLPDSTTLLHCR